MKLSSLDEEKLITPMAVVNNFEEINNLFMSYCWNKIVNFVKFMIKVSMRWENWSEFEGSTFDTISRRRLIEGDTILELTGKIQELQHEVNSMNDSRDFQDAESVRSGQSHVTSQLAFSSPRPDPGGMLSRSLGMPSRNDGAPSIWDTDGKSGNFFANPTASSSAPYPQELNPWSSGISEPIHSSTAEEEWESNTRSRTEMPVWTVSQKFSHFQWRRIFKELWGRPTTTADFGSSFRQIHQAANIACWEDKIQDWGMYLFTISYGRYAVDQSSGVGWFRGWYQIFMLCKRNSNAKFWSTRCEHCFSTEQNHP